jgi:hypothetical protein
MSIHKFGPQLCTSCLKFKPHAEAWTTSWLGYPSLEHQVQKSAVCSDFPTLIFRIIKYGIKNVPKKDVKVKSKYSQAISCECSKNKKNYVVQLSQK